MKYLDFFTMKTRLSILAPILPILAFLTLLGCSSEPAPATNPPTPVAGAVPPPPPPPPAMPLVEELRMQKCPEANLQGSATAEDYDQALDIAITKIAAQIQSSVTASNTAVKREQVSADGQEKIESSFEIQSNVTTQLRNRQDVHVLKTLAREGLVGVVACMSREDAAKPYRQDYQTARDAFVTSMAVLEMTNHPLEKFSNYDKMVEAYATYKSAVQVLESLGFKDGYGDIEENYAKAQENYKEFKSRYKIYFEGSLEAEEGSKIFQELSKKVFLQTILDSACEVGLVLSLELSDPKCKEGGLGVTCTEVVALNGSSCKGETYFTLGATLKGVGRLDEAEAKSKIVNSIDKGDLLADWLKELERWIAR